MPIRTYSQEERGRLTEQVIALKAAGRTWNEIASMVGLKKETARTWFRRSKAQDGPPLALVDGAVPADFMVDPEEALGRAISEWERTHALIIKQKHQIIQFDYGPVGITFFADQHLGSPGVDYERCFEEAQMVMETPGLYVGIVGDLVDNFIVNKLLHLNLTRRLAVADEWALLNLYVEKIADRLVAVVCGNHDWWSSMLTGIDQFAGAFHGRAPHVLYDPHQLDLTVQVDGRSYKGRMRHQWRNYSMYNPTHGMEQLYRMDGAPFDWAVGGHTHVSGLTREFNAGGDTGLAIILGSYKRHDEYARRLGFPGPNNSTAVTIIFDEFGMRGESNLRRAVDYFQSVYGDDEDAPGAD